MVVEAGGAGTPIGDVAFGTASIISKGGGGTSTGGSISARSFQGGVNGLAGGELNTDATTDGSVALRVQPARHQLPRNVDSGVRPDTRPRSL